MVTLVAFIKRCNWRAWLIGLLIGIVISCATGYLNSLLPPPQLPHGMRLPDGMRLPRTVRP